MLWFDAPANNEADFHTIEEQFGLMLWFDAPANNEADFHTIEEQFCLMLHVKLIFSQPKSSL